VPARHRFAAFAHVGYLTNFGKVSAPLVGGGLEARLPWLHSAFAIAVATGYYTSTDHLPSSGGEATSLSMWAVPLYAQLKYRLPLGRFGLEAAAGGGVLFPRLSFTSPAADPVSSSATVGLFTGGVAADADIRYGHVTVAVGYWYAPVAGDLHGNVGGLTLTAGYGFDFL
jgi:hypothetical protein